jgi:glyoxylase-like metal-dependent hydrolase (beta-lactamase superfamily II)
MNSFAPGVFTIALPLPWELESVNVHLVELDEGFLLVDSGVASEECFDTLEASLKSGVAGRAIEWSEIRMLCLTHYHPDHIGLCSKILELSDARLLMHRVEAEYLAEVARESRSPFYEQAMLHAGVPEEMQARIDRAMRDVRRNFRRHEPHWVLEGGEKIPVRGGTLEAVWTPGHSPGHVCLYSPEHRYLISGDHLLQYITPNIAWHPDQDMLAQYLDSLERLRALEVDLILPSHGEPFRGHQQRIAETADHHAARCGEILRRIAQEPLTAHGLVEQMWQPKLSAFHHHFAVFEILAHLDHLERQGRVAARTRGNGSLYWEPTA